MTEKEFVMIELTEQQQRAVDAVPEVHLIDPRTQKAYVLVGAGLVRTNEEPSRGWR